MAKISPTRLSFLKDVQSCTLPVGLYAVKYYPPRQWAEKEELITVNKHDCCKLTEKGVLLLRRHLGELP